MNKFCDNMNCDDICCEYKLIYLRKKKVTFVTIAKIHKWMYIDCINKVKRRLLYGIEK